MNKRLEKIIKEIEEGLRSLKSIIADLETREAKPAFQKAKELFAQEGYRVRNWGALLTDTDEEIYLYRGEEDVGYWADGTNRDTDEAYGLLGLEESSESEDILNFLSDLTAEEGNPLYS